MSIIQDALFMLEQSTNKLESSLQSMLFEKEMIMSQLQESEQYQKVFEEYRKQTLQELYMLRKVLTGEIHFDIQNKKSSKKDYIPSIMMSNDYAKSE